MEFQEAMAQAQEYRDQVDRYNAVQAVAWFQFNRGWLYDVAAATKRLAERQRKARLVR